MRLALLSWSAVCLCSDCCVNAPCVLLMQVGRLLHSLHIDPRALPQQQPDGASWDAVFSTAGDPRLRHPSAAADVAAGSQLSARTGVPNGCNTCQRFFMPSFRLRFACYIMQH